MKRLRLDPIGHSVISEQSISGSVILEPLFWITIYARCSHVNAKLKFSLHGEFVVAVLFLQVTNYHCQIN